MQPRFYVMFPLLSRNAILFPRQLVAMEQNGEIRAQLIVDGIQLIGMSNPSVVSIVTCWQKVVIWPALYNLALKTSYAPIDYQVCVNQMGAAASASVPTKRCRSTRQP